jgi:hypothetical protein
LSFERYQRLLCRVGWALAGLAGLFVAVYPAQAFDVANETDLRNAIFAISAGSADRTINIVAPPGGVPTLTQSLPMLSAGSGAAVPVNGNGFAIERAEPERRGRYHPSRHRSLYTPRKRNGWGGVSVSEHAWPEDACVAHVGDFRWRAIVHALPARPFGDARRTLSPAAPGSW